MASSRFVLIDPVAVKKGGGASVSVGRGVGVGFRVGVGATDISELGLDRGLAVIAADGLAGAVPQPATARTSSSVAGVERRARERPDDCRAPRPIFRTARPAT